MAEAGAQTARPTTATAPGRSPQGHSTDPLLRPSQRLRQGGSTAWPTATAGIDLSGRLGYGPLCRCRATPAAGQGGAMPVEDNKQAAQRFYQEVINARNLDAMDELLTPDGVDHTFGSQNAEQAKQFFGLVHQAFPDLHAEVHDVIAEGELVAARVTYTGTHQGEFVGIPATGKKTTISGVDFFRMQDGRQAEHWGGPDMFSFLVQAGVMPGPGTPA